jgi:NAD(P)-dependent dehydrogenase (short-subunit alcohol dehydrogenase family)
MELRGRWALVTGSAKRVGRVVAHELARRGANVVVHYHSSAVDAEASVTSLRALGVEALALRADLGDAGQVRRLADDAETQTGGVALLVNSASNYLRTPFDTITEAAWDASLDVNLKAPVPGLTRFSVAQDYQPRFQGLVNDLEKGGYTIDPSQSGGYNPRFIANTTTPSEHAYGRAIDVNWRRNPQGGSQFDIPADVARELAKKYGLVWGGDWTGKTRDPMRHPPG